MTHLAADMRKKPMINFNFLIIWKKGRGDRGDKSVFIAQPALVNTRPPPRTINAVFYEIDFQNDSS